MKSTYLFSSILLFSLMVIICEKCLKTKPKEIFFIETFTKADKHIGGGNIYYRDTSFNFLMTGYDGSFFQQQACDSVSCFWVNRVNSSGFENIWVYFHSKTEICNEDYVAKNSKHFIFKPPIIFRKMKEKEFLWKTIEPLGESYLQQNVKIFCNK